MKVISVIGSNSYSVKMFILELAWVMSKDKKIFCHTKDSDFYNCFAENKLNCTEIGNLSIINNLNEIHIDFNPDTYLISDEFIDDANAVIFAVEQNIFSINKINEYANKLDLPEIIFAYIDFIPSNFDDHYFKTYSFDKRLIDLAKYEFYFEFDEKTKQRQLENQFNRIINLKKYPKRRKSNLLSLSEVIIEDDEQSTYREYYKILDERVSVC